MTTEPGTALACRFCGHQVEGDVRLYARRGRTFDERVYLPECTNMPACRERQQKRNEA